MKMEMMADWIDQDVIFNKEHRQSFFMFALIFPLRKKCIWRNKDLASVSMLSATKYHPGCN